MDFLINGGTIIKQIYQAGAEIMLVGDKIRVQPVSILPKELLNELRQYREDVILALPLYPVDLIQKIYMRGMSKHGHSLEERAIIKVISSLDWADISKRYDFELNYWANEIAPSAICNCGLVPHDWNKAAKCHDCGWVFSSKSGDCLACPWCEVRAAGVWFPTPGLNRCANPETINGCVVQECKVQPGKLDVVIPECFFCGERLSIPVQGCHRFRWKVATHSV